MNTYPKFSHNSYINPCLQPRQVGSTIKAFLYTLGFHQLGYTAESTIKDEPIQFDSTYGKYAPQNFDLQYHGDISMAEALGNSLNIPAIKLVSQLGVSTFYLFLNYIADITNAQDIKRDDDIQDLGLAIGLGIKEISPIEYTKMRTIFDICSSPNQTSKTSLFCKNFAYNISQIKKILSQNQNRLISFGQYNWFDVLGTYSKSGTSRHFVDAWICGGKKGYTVCMRAGNLDATPMKGGGHEVLGPLWYDVMSNL